MFNKLENFSQGGGGDDDIARIDKSGTSLIESRQFLECEGFYLKTSKTPCLVCHSDGSVLITTLGEVVITDTGLLPPLVPSSEFPFISACDVLISFSIATTLS